MGLYMSKIYDLFVGKKQARILMIGLDGAGKTTILYKLKLGDVVSTIPTLGFNVESVQYKNIDFNVWDVGGQEAIRPLWRYYYENCSGLIYVVDSNDPLRLKEAAQELESALSEDVLRGVPVLVLANKQDLPQAVSADQVKTALALDRFGDRQTLVQRSVAQNGEGIYEGLDWLARQI